MRRLTRGADIGKSLIVFFALVICLAVGCGDGPTDAPSAAPSEYSITGEVTDSVLGQPLSGIEISFGSATVTTNASGRYIVTLTEGQVIVSVNASGYESFSETVSLNTNMLLDIPLGRL